MNNFSLEVCADSVESVLAAERGGANRIELCQNLIIGGTTPNPSLFREIRRFSDTKIHVLIRPRYGDFCYTDHEFSIMKEDIKLFRQLGAQGIVIGILKPDGSLDIERMSELIEEAGNMSVTLHRAFDVCADPFIALEQAIELGINTILTSGQKNNCIDGADLLKELKLKSRDEIEIQIGAGVTANAIRELFPKTGIQSFHMSGKTIIDSAMTYRKKDINMGMPFMSEFNIIQTDENLIREVIELFATL